VSHHRQISVQGIELDEGIAPLVETLWSSGYATQGSCEDMRAEDVPPMFGADGVATIVFPNRRDSQRFTRLCAGAFVRSRSVELDLELDHGRNEEGYTSDSRGVLFPLSGVPKLVAALEVGS
jgi:hypothetical protein